MDKTRVLHNMTSTYQTEFTRENVRALTKHIQQGIRTYADERQRPIDLFVIAAALQQATYEIVLRSLCDSKEEGEKKIEEMKPISAQLIQSLDTYRKDNPTMPTEELLGTIFASNLLVEFYAHNRDLKLKALADMNGKEVVEDQQELEVEKGQDEVIRQDEAKPENVVEFPGVQESASQESSSSSSE